MQCNQCPLHAGVKKLGGKKLGGAKVAKVASATTTDWDNAEAALPANEPDAMPAEEITSEEDGFNKLTSKQQHARTHATTDRHTD